MKRKAGLVSGLATGVLLASVLVASAAPGALPGTGWWTSIQIQNVGTDTATIAYTAYWQVGQGGAESDTTYSQDGVITVTTGASVIYNPGQAPNYPAGSRVGFNTADKHLPSGFSGGLQVSSDSPIRAVASVGNNIQGTVGTTGGQASAFYQSTQGEDVSNRILFPVAKNNYFGQSTTMYVQAAGVAATIVATFTSPGGAYPVNGGTPINIPAGKTFQIDPGMSSMPSGNVAAALGSLTVQAVSGSIAGAILETPANTVPAKFALATKGFSDSDADTTIFVPTNKVSFNNSSTGWQILNTTGNLATAVVTFTVTAVQAGTPAATSGIAAGMRFRANIDIGGGGSYLFSKQNGNYYKATEVGGSRKITDGVFFSGIAVATQPVVATVNEANGPWRLVYSAFGANKSTAKAAAPLVKEAFFGNTTSFNVQNVGTLSTTVTAMYNCVAGTTKNTYTLGGVAGGAAFRVAPGAALNFFRLNNVDGRWGTQLVPSGNNCAVTVTTDGQPVVAVAQESNLPDSATPIDYKNYEAFSLTP